MASYSSRRESVCVLEEDPDLGRLLHARDYGAALRDARAPVLSLESGVGNLTERLRPDAGSLGWLLLDGSVMREVRSGNGAFVEFIGPGDLLCPADLLADEEMVEQEVHCATASPTRFAFLDREFTMTAARWPELTAAVIERAGRRATRLALGTAISNIPRVDQRLLTALWLLAERWGRVSSDGVLLSVKPSHSTLGKLIGAQRPTVTRALRELRARGEVERRADGRLVLVPRPEQHDAVATAKKQPRADAFERWPPDERHAELRARLRRAHELHELQADRLRRHATVLRAETDELSAVLRRWRPRGERGDASAER